MALKDFNGVLTHSNTQNYLAQVLGAKKQEFVNNITALVANDAALQDCDPLSVMYAAIKATALDLPLDKNLGFAYVIPYLNRAKNIKEAQFQMGYKGFVQLAIRSGQFSTINVTDVREGEIVSEDLLTGEMKLKRLEGDRQEAQIVGYIAYFRLTNGFEKTLFMSYEDMIRHATEYSQTFRSTNQNIRNQSKWTTDFDAMAKKTVLKLLLGRFAPLSVEMRGAIKADQSVITETGEVYVDNQQQAITSDDMAARMIEQSKENLSVVQQAMQAQEAEAQVIEEKKKKVTKEQAADLFAQFNEEGK